MEIDQSNQDLNWVPSECKSEVLLTIWNVITGVEILYQKLKGEDICCYFLFYVTAFITAQPPSVC